nr:DUF6270 domain-containing protein [Lysobacter lactosilyticus]
MKRVFILGSCVSRDALEQVPGAFEVAAYLARTSMASIGMARVDDASAREVVANLPSAFQRRMLFNDLDKTTLATIAATPHDVLLVDCIDERFPLVRADDSFYSYSGEMQKGGLSIEGRETIAPDSDAFVEAWLAGFEKFLGAIDTSRVVLNRALWAEHFPDGTPVSSMGWIRRSNATLCRLYDVVAERWTLPSIDYPDALIVGDPAHRWGVAPYHYTQPFYEHTIASLRALVDAR